MGRLNLDGLETSGAVVVALLEAIEDRRRRRILRGRVELAGELLAFVATLAGVLYFGGWL